MSATKSGRRPRHILVREYAPDPDACVRAATILVDWWLGRTPSSFPVPSETTSPAAGDATGAPRTMPQGQTLPAAGASSTPEALR